MTEIAAVEVLIRGRVQGVYFRAWTREQAVRRDLSGWVRNNADRTVSALFVGESAIVDEMVAACREGPLDARVEAVERMDVDPLLERRGFRVLR